ncbi:unnamed protein product [Colias eurytheme]|nr:unnamed protein product [Colias eurytheme]
MSEVQMLITKYTAILLESARSVEARNTALSRSTDGDWSSLERAAHTRRPWRRRTLAYRCPPAATTAHARCSALLALLGGYLSLCLELRVNI